MSDGRISRIGGISNLFLSAGAMKAGTTWLYFVLKQHPRIIATPLKEIHFFAQGYTHWDVLSKEERLNRFKEYISWQTPEFDIRDLASDLNWFKHFLNEPVDLDWFSDLFPGKTSDKYCSDFSNLTALMDDSGWRRVRASADKVRVSYIIRNPINRYWSHIKFHMSIFSPTLDLDLLSVDDYAKILNHEDFRPHGEYSRFISCAQRNLDDNEFIIINCEELHADPLRGLYAIEDFLGIEHHAYAEELLKTKLNQSPSTLGMPQSFMQACQRSVDEELERLCKLGVDTQQLLP